ncbi:hypothetical protein OKW24_000324 [Peribacillus simplex]|nr:hypothetical protein [Peribacillus simplex]
MAEFKYKSFKWFSHVIEGGKENEWIAKLVLQTR